MQNHNIYKNIVKTLVQNLLTNYKQRDNITTQSKRLRRHCANREKRKLTEVQNVNEKDFGSSTGAVRPCNCSIRLRKQREQFCGQSIRKQRDI